MKEEKIRKDFEQSKATDQGNRKLIVSRHNSGRSNKTLGDLEHFVILTGWHSGELNILG